MISKILQKISGSIRTVNINWEAISSHILNHSMPYMSMTCTTINQYKGSVTKF